MKIRNPKLGSLLKNPLQIVFFYKRLENMNLAAGTIAIGTSLPDTQRRGRVVKVLYLTKSFKSVTVKHDHLASDIIPKNLAPLMTQLEILNPKYFALCGQYIFAVKTMETHFIELNSSNEQISSYKPHYYIFQKKSAGKSYTADSWTFSQQATPRRAAS